MEEENKKSEPQAPARGGRINAIMLKVLMLIIFALMMGMCTIKYMS